VTEKSISGGSGSSAEAEALAGVASADEIILYQQGEGRQRYTLSEGAGE
jgi:hypothetical protein